MGDRFIAGWSSRRIWPGLCIAPKDLKWPCTQCQPQERVWLGRCWSVNIMVFWIVLVFFCNWELIWRGWNRWFLLLWLGKVSLLASNFQMSILRGSVILRVRFFRISTYQFNSKHVMIDCSQAHHISTAFSQRPTHLEKMSGCAAWPRMEFGERPPAHHSPWRRVLQCACLSLPLRGTRWAVSRCQSFDLQSGQNSTRIRPEVPGVSISNLKITMITPGYWLAASSGILVGQSTTGVQLSEWSDNEETNTY